MSVEDPMALLRVTFRMVRLSSNSVSHLFLSADPQFPLTYDWACPAFASHQGNWKWKVLNPASSEAFIVCKSPLSGGVVRVAELFRRPAPWQLTPNRQTFHVGDRGEAFLLLNVGQPPDFTWTIVFVH